MTKLEVANELTKLYNERHVAAPADVVAFVLLYGQSEYERGRREATTTFPPAKPGQGSKM